MINRWQLLHRREFYFHTSAELKSALYVPASVLFYLKVEVNRKCGGSHQLSHQVRLPVWDVLVHIFAHNKHRNQIRESFCWWTQFKRSGWVSRPGRRILGLCLNTGSACLEIHNLRSLTSVPNHLTSKHTRNVTLKCKRVFSRFQVCIASKRCKLIFPTMLCYHYCCLPIKCKDSNSVIFLRQFFFFMLNQNYNIQFICKYNLHKTTNKSIFSNKDLMTIDCPRTPNCPPPTCVGTH